MQHWPEVNSHHYISTLLRMGRVHRFYFYEPEALRSDPARFPWGVWEYTVPYGERA